MAIIHGMLLSLFLGGIGVSGYYYRNAIEVTMEDNSKHRGNLTSLRWPRMDAAWLFPRFIGYVEGYQVFIRFPSNIAYRSELEPFHLVPNHDRRRNAPKFAEVSFKREKRFYKSAEFEYFDVTDFDVPASATYPPEGYIYVAKPGGLPYRAAYIPTHALEAQHLGRF